MLQNLTSLRKKSLQCAHIRRNYARMDARPTLSPRLRALFAQLAEADNAGDKQLAAAIRVQIADLLLGVTP